MACTSWRRSRLAWTRQSRYRHWGAAKKRHPNTARALHYVWHPHLLRGLNGWPAERWRPRPRVTLTSRRSCGAGWSHLWQRLCHLPDADPSDSLLDVCYNVKIPSRPWLLSSRPCEVFGRHTGSSCVNLPKFTRTAMDFRRKASLPGRRRGLCGTHFRNERDAKALRVIVP